MQNPLQNDEWQGAVADLVAEGAAPLRNGNPITDSNTQVLASKQHLRSLRCFAHHGSGATNCSRQCCKRRWGGGVLVGRLTAATKAICEMQALLLWDSWCGRKGWQHGQLRAPNNKTLDHGGCERGFLWLQVAQAVIKQVAGRPCLLNLSRSLAYHKRTLSEEPLTLREAEQQQQLVNNLSDTLRTILCL